ncbi:MULTISPECIES: hypothetical protein [Inquilinus]|uniref:Uncharacterized protein n=1 Tax=Inquilinus ginsengisoli TaxID=363840 RepID=A0ABU1JTX6_9PROT|nr:hypothetical protein [Inquilinus ginsengisoli]MDR6292075.1 hypothetical protein [Inquilinus ginsengisoli]
MTRCNRVTPFGEIVADPARGAMLGNRGVLHDADGRIRRPWSTTRWICCRLQFKGRWRQVMTPNRWTHLFFLDEAVAIAAGHRPCAECRREAYNAWRAAWARAEGLAALPSAEAMDRVMHPARIDPATRRQRTVSHPIATLPDAAIVALPDDPGGAWLVLGGTLRRWDMAGYGAARPRPASGRVGLLTPLPSVAVLAAGYRPELHPSLRAAP